MGACDSDVRTTASGQRVKIISKMRAAEALKRGYYYMMPPYPAAFPNVSLSLYHHLKNHLYHGQIGHSLRLQTRIP